MPVSHRTLQDLFKWMIKYNKSIFTKNNKHKIYVIQCEREMQSITCEIPA